MYFSSAPGRSRLATAAWFYGIWLSLFLIILFLVAFFFLKRVRDRWWDTKGELTLYPLLSINSQHYGL